MILVRLASIALVTFGAVAGNTHWQWAAFGLVIGIYIGEFFGKNQEKGSFFYKKEA